MTLFREIVLFHLPVKEESGQVAIETFFVAKRVWVYMICVSGAQQYQDLSQVPTRFDPHLPRRLQELERTSYQKPARKKLVKTNEIMLTSINAYVYLLTTCKTSAVYRTVPG